MKWGLVLVTHGSLGKTLLDTAFSIVGRQENCWVVGLSPERGIEELKKKLQKVAKNGEGNLLILADFFGGSPCRAALSVFGKTHPVLTGVNLPMLLSFLNFRDRGVGEELPGKLLREGRRGILNAGELVAARHGSRSHSD